MEEALRRGRYQETIQVDVRNQQQDEDEAEDEPSSVSTTSTLYLVPLLDELHGGIQWTPLQVPSTTITTTTKSNDTTNITSKSVLWKRHLQTKRWMFPMLNDTRRNSLYQRAIQQALEIHTAKQQQTKSTTNNDDNDTTSVQCHVLDIGSGTGLLSMMAATQTGAVRKKLPVVHVTAVEMSTAMADLARQTIHDNQLQDRITLYTGHSSQLTLSNTHHHASFSQTNDAENHDSSHPLYVSQPFDLVVSELLESGVLGEGVLPTLRHLYNQSDGLLLLRDDTMILPQRIRVYCTAITTHDTTPIPWIAKYYGPHVECTTANVGNEKVPLHLSLEAPTSFDKNKNDVFLLDAQQVVFPIHGHLISTNHDTSPTMNTTTTTTIPPPLHSISEPVQVLEIDLRRNQIPDPQGQRQIVALPIVADHTTTVHGFLVWWELDLWCKDNDDDNDGKEKESFTYSTAPGSPWQDHWHCCLHVLPRDKHCVVHKGETLVVQASHDDTRIYMDLVDTNFKSKETSFKETTSPDKKRPRIHSNPPSTSCISPERAFQLNDTERTQFFCDALLGALKVKGPDVPVLDLSDFSLCAILAGCLGFNHVRSLESSSGDLPMTSARVAQIGNGMPRQGLFEILQCHAEQLTSELVTEPIQVIMAEYYEILEGWELETFLNFYHLVRALSARDLISSTAITIPGRVKVMGALIESEQLRSAYRSCGDEEQKICGLDHSTVNRYGGDFSVVDLSLPMWQYSYRKLSSDLELVLIDCTKPSSDNIRTTVKTSFPTESRCDALMIWLEYSCDMGNDGALTFSSLRQSSKQLIRMLPKSVSVASQTMKDLEVEVLTSIGGLEDQLKPYDIQVKAL